MKLRTKHIMIEPKEYGLHRFAHTYEKLQHCDKVKPWRGLAFPTIAEFRKVFTDKRIELLKIIRNHEPVSIYALAKILKRDYKNVYQDVKFLENLGLIDQGSRNLSISYDKITMECRIID